jgi:preprotein translocase subunit SecD
MKNKNFKVRVIIIAVITLAGIYAVFGPRHKPTKQDFTWTGLKANLQKNINLGLDLKGGSYLVMRVKVEEGLKRLCENSALGVMQLAKEKGLPVTNARPDVQGENYRFVIETSDPSKSQEIQDAVKTRIGESEWSVSSTGNTITYTLTTAAVNYYKNNFVEQALKIINERIDRFGVQEPTLQRHGAASSYQLLLQMPGLQDTQRVKELVKGDSRLELVHVISPPSPERVKTYSTQQEAKLAAGGAPNRRVLLYRERDEPTDATNQQPQDPNNKRVSWVVVEVPIVVDGSELREAQAVSRTQQDNDYQISFSLKPSGAEKFGAWTAANINEYMGVVLDDEVKSIAYIKSTISDSGEISGSFTKETAQDLALTLNSGALPAGIEYQEERTVGPSLGADSIRAGVTASVAGLLFVMAFILFYYRGSGINAVLALLLNMLLTIAGLVIMNATLTLPGIAGLILTIGMAVDSNVLVFERIREELREGKTVLNSVDLGFGHAFVTIIDTHVTTIISSLFLFVFGTGPIRGFAVTLILGLVINLFTAVYVSRTIFMWHLGRKRKVESLSI